MGARIDFDPFKDIRKQAKQQYETELHSIGLGQAQLLGQSLPELRDSLERINDAIKNPDSFPKFNIAMGGRVGVPYVTSRTAESHYQVTILTTLLERKKLILDRIRDLESNDKFDSLHDLINKKVSDPEVQEKLSEELNRYVVDSHNLKEQYQQVVNAQSDQLEQSEADKLKLSMELWERRSKMLLPFLERESAATIIGAILLLIIALAHLIALGFNLVVSQTLDSAFLLILGYFFGQSTSQNSTNRSS